MTESAPRQIAMALSMGAASLLLACSNSDASGSSVPGEVDGSTADSGPACVVPTEGPPTDVFCTGLYRNHDTKEIAASAKPYTPGVLLWSDGAEKQRYLYLPPSTTIDTSDMDAWKFPVGTKAWKEFRLAGSLVETRLLWKRSEALWETATYIWNAPGTEATLNVSRTPTIVLDGYEIPDSKDCGKCHHGASDKLLGVEAVALALPSAQGVTLSTLTADGRLSHPPPATEATLPEDSTGKAGAALAFLHANCGMPCHSSRGLGEETKLVLRVRAGEIWPDTSVGATSAADLDAYVASWKVAPTTAAVAQKFPGALRITPGSHETSLLWLLSHRRGDYQMPPLVSHEIDEVGSQRLADWIDALAP